MYDVQGLHQPVIIGFELNPQNKDAVNLVVILLTDFVCVHYKYLAAPLDVSASTANFTADWTTVVTFRKYLYSSNQSLYEHFVRYHFISINARH